MLNTMDERDLRDDPVRHYMLRPSDRARSGRPIRVHTGQPARARHVGRRGPDARYPPKVLVELLATCPQYCGHCTRMDLVGHSTAQFVKYRFAVRERDRRQAMLDHIRANAEIRDVLVSRETSRTCRSSAGGVRFELLDMPHVRDIRLASSLSGAPAALPPARRPRGAGAGEEGSSARESASPCTRTRTTPVRSRRSSPALRTRCSTSASATSATRPCCCEGQRTSDDQLDLSLALLDRASITPYYAYLCDMVPNAEHWRTALWEAQEIQAGIMGYLPGYATPRLVCDVPLLGKLWVHQVAQYDRELGSAAGVQTTGRPTCPDGFAEYYDPIHTLPESGQAWWRAEAQADR